MGNNNNLDFTFLTKEQVLGSNLIFGPRRLEIFKNYGTQAFVTDFSILSGLYRDYFSPDKKLGNWWTKSKLQDWEPNYINDIGLLDDARYSSYSIGIRPAVSYSAISSLCTNKLKDASGSVVLVEYGEYPQDKVNYE